MFVVDESKIVNRTYKDVMQVFSYDNANEIELPWSGQFLVLLRNQFGALPVVDYFEGNRYKLNEVIYHYRGSNVMEFIKVGGTRKTMLLVPLSVQMSAYNMENDGIKRAYIPELEKEIQKVLEVIRNSGANVTNKEKAFLNNLKFIEKELTDKSNVVFGKVEEVLNEVALVDQESERFLSLVRENERLVDEKYHKFDVSVTTANQTIDDILALQPQFQAVIDETTGKDVISAPEIILARGGETDLKTRLDKEHQEVTAQLAQTIDDINHRGVNLKSYEHLVVDGDWTLALQTALNNHTHLFIPEGTYNINGEITVKNFGQTIKGVGNKYGGSRLLFDTDTIALKVMSSVIYVYFENIKLEGVIDIKTDYYRTGTTGIELNGTHLETSGLWMSNFETLIESVSGGYYHYLSFGRFEKFKLGFKNFSANNFNCVGNRFISFNDCFEITRGDGTFNIKNNSFEIFNGRLVVTIHEGERSVDFSNNYVEIFHVRDLPTNFPNGEATGAKPGKFGGNILFQGTFENLIINNNELQIPSVFRIISTTNRSNLLEMLNNHLIIYETGNNLELTTKNSFNTFRIDNNISFISGDGGFDREYSQGNLSSINPYRNSYFYDCVTGKIRFDSGKRLDLTLINGWKTVSNNPPRLTIVNDGFFLRGMVDGSSMANRSFAVVPLEKRPVEHSTSIDKITFNTINYSTKEPVTLTYEYDTGIIAFESSTSAKDSIMLEGLYVSARI